MYVTTRKSKSNVYVYLAESKRVGKKTTTTLVKKLGSLADLTKDNPNALEELKAKYADQRSQKALVAKHNAETAVNAILSTSVATDRDSACPVLNYGWYALRQIWTKELQLTPYINYLQGRDNSKHDFNFNSAIAAQSFFKVLQPGSVRSVFDAQDNLLGAPLKGISYDQLLSSLDFLSTHKDDILKHINQCLDKKLDRHYEMVFYDVTNAYIETPLSDEERNIVRTDADSNIKTILAKAVDERIIPADSLDVDGLLKENAFLPFELEKQLKFAMYLRMRGLSKEHRYDLPLISIAMVIDEHAIPIDYEIYAGNASEFGTMKTSIEKMKAKYGIKETVVVADRGLNSTNNLQMLLDNQFGFLMAQKVSALPKTETDLMLSDEGWNYIGTDKETSLRHKAIPFKKSAYISGKKVQVDCTLIFTFSPTRKRRDEKQLNNEIERARIAIANAEAISGSHRSWTTLVKKEGKAPTAKSLDEAAIKVRRSKCGYAGIVYHAAPNSPKTLTPLQITTAYHSLVKIEDCFRVMKSSLSLRPMYVRLDSHIKGHCMLCILALILLRLCQLNLEKEGVPLSLNDIVDALWDAKVTALRTGEKTLYINSKSYGWVRKNREDWSEEQLKEFLKTAKSNTTLCMQICGLEPIPQVTDRIALGKCLGTRFTDDESALGSLINSIL